MSVISFGFYLFYWFYVTWKQYRDHTGEEVFPVWHAMTLGVPIYSLFRTHAHARVLKELMIDRSLATTIAPGWAVAAVMLSSAIDWNSLRAGLGEIEGLTQATAVRLFFQDVVSIAVVAWLLTHLQGNLNRYWQHVSSGRLLSAKIGVGEVIIAVIGVLLWLDTLATLFNESYRLGL